MSVINRGWTTDSAVGRGIATPHYLIEDLHGLCGWTKWQRCTAYGGQTQASAMESKTFFLKLLLRRESCASHVQPAGWQAGAKHALLIRVCDFTFLNKKVYRSAVRLQGFTKDLTSAETNSIFASPQLLLLLPVFPQRAPHGNDKHETCLSLAFGVSASQSLHLIPIGPNSPRGVRV